MEDTDSSTGWIGPTRDHISIEIRHPHGDLVTSIRRRMEEISSLHCICRVKENLRMENEKAYIPEKVSIGPYHHGQDKFKDMEDQKWRYVFALLSRKPNLEAVLDDCVKGLQELEYRARACYADEINFGENEFLQMILMDGCFIIELFLKYSIKSLRRQNDPIFSTPGMLFGLRCDLILLENQIPLFVLQRLFQLVPIPKQCTHSISELAFRFFRNMIPGDEQVHREKFKEEGNHLLDLICHCLLPTYPRVPAKQSKLEKPLPCAIELQSHGIGFKKARTENLLDIRFVNGVLQIPPIIVHRYTERLLGNLIALEQCSSDSVQHITSYAFLMKSIICTDKDVKLLQQKDIVTNHDASEKDVSVLFERLCKDKEVNVKEFYFNRLCEQVNGYKGTGVRVWYKKLKRSYHRHPLLRLVLFLALLILFLTLVGTLFSVLSFSLHHF